MNTEICSRLIVMLRAYNNDIVRDVRRCESLIRDYCSDSTVETRLLILALKEEVPQEILNAMNAGDDRVRERLVNKLQTNLAMNVSASERIVDTWSYVLIQNSKFNSSTDDDGGLVSDINAKDFSSSVGFGSGKVFASIPMQEEYGAILKSNWSFLMGFICFLVLISSLLLIFGSVFKSSFSRSGGITGRFAAHELSVGVQEPLSVAKNEITDQPQNHGPSNSAENISTQGGLQDLSVSAVGDNVSSVSAESPVSQKKDSNEQKKYSNSINMQFVFVNSGVFSMGNGSSKEFLESCGIVLPDNYTMSDESPKHRVNIGNDFYIGMHEVTRGQFEAFVNATNYKTSSEYNVLGGFGIDTEGKFLQNSLFSWKNSGITLDNSHPVVNVSFDDAHAFCYWLSQKEGRKYRLPTEAEWEYVCRAGSDSVFQNGDLPENLVRIGNVADQTAKESYSHWNSINARDFYVFSSPVGSFQPNLFGVYDMVGNVWEWVDDYYGNNYYEVSPFTNPVGPASGEFRVRRGGSWFSDAKNCRSACRDKFKPSDYGIAIGFRVVLETP